MLVGSAMGLLDGDLAKSIYEGFKGRLLSGEVRRNGPSTSAGLDDHGDPLDLQPQTWDVEGFIDDYSRTVRAQAGIPNSDVKACIFAQSAPDYNPKMDDLVRLGARWVRLSGGPIGIDPAGALWTCQASEIEAPL